MALRPIVKQGCLTPPIHLRPSHRNTRYSLIVQVNRSATCTWRLHRVIYFKIRILALSPSRILTPSVKNTLLSSFEGRKDWGVTKVTWCGGKQKGTDPKFVIRRTKKRPVTRVEGFCNKKRLKS
ncbi:hypothetical protein J6590_018096 [Homalodisca vitripennis]|nr:hypothetical protein J6590_018096 [Homalodisca vitripennis]